MSLVVGEPAGGAATAFVSCAADRGLGFRAVRSACSVDGDGVRLPKDVAAALGAHPGDTVGVTALAAER
jgi:arginine/ornithine N-succinyltransferase beta subunit